MTFTDNSVDEGVPLFEGPDDSAGPAGFACDECGFTAKTALGLAQHKGKKHAGGPSAGRGPSKPRVDSLRSDAEAFCLFFYGLNGQVVSSVDPVCGQALMACQGPATDAWYQAAKKNATVRKMLKSIANVGIWGGLVNAHMPLIAAVYGHHVQPMFAPQGVPEGGEGTEAAQTGFVTP
jgi:hypothetical protein